MGAMKTILFSLATTDTAGPSAEVRVPTRKSTFSLRISSRETRTASSALPLVSRGASSSLRPSTPPCPLISSTNIWAPLRAGSPKSAPGPDRIMGKPTLMGFCWASPAGGTISVAASKRVSTRRRCMESSLSENGLAGDLRPGAIERRRGGDEQRLVVVVTPREVGRVFGHLENLEQPSLGIERVDAPRARAVHVARAVDLHAVGRAGSVALRLRPESAVGEAAGRRDIEHPDVLARGVVDEEPALVERETQTVGAVEVVDQQLGVLGVGAHPVHALEAELLRSLDAIELGAAVRRIREVDRAVAPADDVVGAVELLALEVRGQHGEPASGVRPGHPTGGVLASEQARRAVVGVAVGRVAGLAERGDAGRRRPAAHVVAGHVAEDQELAGGMPDGPLGEEEARAQLFEAIAHFLTGWPGVPAAYQSAGGTSSNTTHTAWGGTLHPSVMVWVTRRAISSLRSLPWPSYKRMFTNGMVCPPVAEWRKSGHESTTPPPTGQAVECQRWPS